MGDIERARSAGFDAAQTNLNAQGGHLTPEDRPLFDAAVDAALEAVNYQGAVDTFREIARASDPDCKLTAESALAFIRRRALDQLRGR